MATLVTSVSTVGATAANTALQPSLGKVDAWLKHSKNLTYCVPNEHVCATIARHIGLPVPASGIVYKQGNDPEYFFASLNFNLSNSQLPPIDITQCITSLEFFSVGVVLFDVLVGNSDRHRNNLSLDTSRNPPLLTVFDHSHALFGHTNGGGRARLIGLQGQLGIGGHCLLTAITRDAHFPEWISRIASLPDYLIDDACDATVPWSMITVAEATEAKRFLKQRRSEIETIVKANKPAFTAISQWSLLP